MARIELNEEQKKAIENIGKKNNALSTDEHYLLQYAEGEFNYHSVVIVVLKNSLGIKKYIVPSFSQLALRSKFYLENGIADFLEKDLSNNKIIHTEKYVELQLELNGELDIFFVNKDILE